MNYLLSMHASLPTTTLLLLGVLVLWGLVNIARGSIARLYGAAMAVAELLLLSEFIIGVVLLLLSGRQPAQLALHLVYGLVAVLTLPGAVIYAHERSPRTTQVIYLMACFFLGGILLRALATGR